MRLYNKFDSEGVIVVSGGRFAPRHEQTRTAGSLMEDWLADHGVPLSDIIVEGESVDTYENIAFSIKALGENGIDPKTTLNIVVSERLHAMRIEHTFKAAHGIEVNTHNLPDRPGLFRWITDRFFVLYHWWDTYGDGWLARMSRKSRHKAAKS